MCRTFISNIHNYYRAGNRWWIPLLAGLTGALSFAPFNHETSIWLAPFPLLSFVSILPLFYFSTRTSLKKSAFHSYLYGITASLVQFYWLVFVRAEGVWHLILIGVVLMSVVFAACYLVLGLAFRMVHRRFPVLFMIVYPAIWVLYEYGRSLGDISFPWALAGYGVMPLPIAQWASVGGVFGLSVVVLMVNCVIWWVAGRWFRAQSMRNPLIVLMMTITVLGGLWGWGVARQNTGFPSEATVRFSCLQANLDQLHWGNSSLEQSFITVRDMVMSAAVDTPDVIVTSESALLCYLDRQPPLKRQVMQWIDQTRIPMIIGALHWDPAVTAGSDDDYRVYNTAFYADTGFFPMRRYYKMKLVPFSEALPFQGVFPILSRVNLGQAGFIAGSNPALFRIRDRIAAVPLICYEVIYPDFVRRRLGDSGTVMVNITNDGWFGRSTGPYQHAMMARMRCIENGISLVRCANSGISITADQFGRVRGKTGLYERVVLTRDVSLYRVRTYYSRAGDWPVVACLLVVVGAVLLVLGKALCRSRAPLKA